MDIKIKVGLRIRAVRKRKAISQAMLAEMVGRSTEGISQLERGINFPTHETLERLSDILGVPVKEFFEFDETDKEEPQRVQNLFDLMTAARSLGDKQLVVAVRQIEVLAEIMN